MEEESLSRSRQLLTENEMSYQSETTSRHVISTIQSCHGTLEQLVNCILEYIWRIHIYWEYTACAWVGNFQLRMECHIKARQRQGISFNLFRAIVAPWNSPSTASLKSFGGSIIWWGEEAWAEVGNCQLRMGCHIKARQREGMSFQPFRTTIAPWNSPSTASLKSFGGSIIWWGGRSLSRSWQLSTENGMSC